MLLDTNVLIDVLKGHADAVRFVDGLSSKPSVSVITVAELVAGARNQREEVRLLAIFSDLHVLPVTAEVARRAGALVRIFAAQGVELPDALIAATAEQYEIPLATLNVKHFPMFKRLKPAYRA